MKFDTGKKVLRNIQCLSALKKERSPLRFASLSDNLATLLLLLEVRCRVLSLQAIRVPVKS